MKKTVSKHFLPVIGQVKKVTIKEQLYILGEVTYAHWDKFVKHIITGTAVISKNTNKETLAKQPYLFEYDEKAERVALHKKFHLIKGFDFKAGEMYNGYIVCSESNIPVITKYINDFFNSKTAKEAGIVNIVTLFHTCKPYTGDINIESKLEPIINKDVPEAVPAS